MEKENLMARHRVGNSYLSDEELSEHQSENWKVWIFVIAALCTGFVVANITDGKIDLKLMRFSIIIGSAILVGVIAAKLSEIIRWAVYLSIVLGITFFAGSLIWSSL